MPKDSFRIATFNVENLFMRYRFRANQPAYEGAEGFTINQLAFDIYDEEQKRITAEAIREVSADVLCLQEVESLPCLDTFNARYLPRRKGFEPYRHRILVDSHDPRHIDVAVLSRYPIVHVRTHRDDRRPKRSHPIFSRDCLEVDVQVPVGAKSKIMTLYVNHLKSMVGGRNETRDRRADQAQRVVEILEERWGAGRDAYQGNFAVVGDLNDYMDAQTSLTPLVRHKALVNVVDRLPKDEQWTHHYAGRDQYRQLDYLLLGQALDARADEPEPGIMRKGLPWRAAEYEGPRFESVGEEEPKASDHCPLYVDVPFRALA